jgi:hypothetical protein
MVATGTDASGCCNEGKQRKNNQRIIKIRRDYSQNINVYLLLFMAESLYSLEIIIMRPLLTVLLK